MKIEIVEPTHLRSHFSCGETSLDLYLQKQAIKEIRRQHSFTYVLNNKEKMIAGYYTLSSITVEVANYSFVSGVIISRLAVDQQYQKKGYGEMMLVDALHRIYDSNQEKNPFTIIANVINKNAIQFYKKYGFTSFIHQEDMLYLPMKMVDSL